MAEWIKSAKVGDKVVCVEVGWSDAVDEIVPEFGRVYTIRDIEVDWDGVFFKLSEIKNEPTWYSDGFFECVFEAENFRPVQPRQTDISIFTRLLNTTPADLVEA